MRDVVLMLLMMGFAITNMRCHAPKEESFQPREVYRSKDLVVVQIAENSFQHISFLQTDDFGNVPCNGLVVRSNQQVIVFDTPTNDQTSEELIRWIKDTLRCEINAIIPTHFHNDCLAGLNAFHQFGIPSYANVITIALAKENMSQLPQHGFSDSLRLKIGNEVIQARFFGEGHTRDNVVGYFASDHVLFGGCLVKELEANKGYLGDANTTEWSRTVERIKKEYPNLKVVVPGHGEHGDTKLLDYTIALFKNR